MEMEKGALRFIKDDTIVSRATPRLTIRYSNDFIFLGSMQYIAQETHHIDAYIFLNPNIRGHAASVMLVHFEGLLEGREGSCMVPGDDTILLGGDMYQYQRRFISAATEFKRSAGTPLALAGDYIRQRAYTLAGDMIYHHFWRYLENDNRDSFSISFLEATEDGQAAAELADSDPAEAQAMLQRALRSFELIQ